MAARLGDLHHVPHEREGLFGQVNAVLGIAVLEHAGQAGHGPADGHIPVGTPDDVLRLLAEAALLGAAVALVPHSGAPPDPARPLEGVGGRGELPPVDEHTHRRAGLADLSGIPKPLRRPAGPGPLVLGVPVEGRGRVIPHAGILLGRGLVLLCLGTASRGVRRVGDDRIEGAGGKAAQQLQRVAVENLPLIVHGHPCLSFEQIFEVLARWRAPSPDTR